MTRNKLEALIEAITAWNTRASEAHTLRVAEAVREACARWVNGNNGEVGNYPLVSSATPSQSQFISTQRGDRA